LGIVVNLSIPETDKTGAITSYGTWDTTERNIRTVMGSKIVGI